MRALGFGKLVGLTLGMMLALALIWPGAAHAQDRVFIQIESNSTLSAAESRARAYAQLLTDVTAFRARTGLYAIALGPYERADAQAMLRDLRARGLVPRDSFLIDGAPYVAQVFPVVGTPLATAAPIAPPTPIEVTSPAALPPPPEAAPEPAPTEAAPAPTPEPTPEETLAQARQSESQLDRAGRDGLQVALQWFGYYRGGIDGAFGPGTRNAMSAWQQEQGFAPTGVLTTAQRAQLLEGYQGEVAALGMEPLRDTRAGIEIDLPLGLVAFEGYNFPFARYAPAQDSGVQVLLISQPGGRDTLFGLYEIMQTLDIVPLTGERARQNDRFVLTGQSDRLRSHSEARLVGGAVKGFTLVWPPEQDARIARVLPMMQASFRAIDGVLDPGAVPDTAAESPDLIAGLSIRKPARVRSGFYIDAGGHVLTTTDAVAGSCSSIQIDAAYPAEILHQDAALGLAVLRPLQRLAPMAFAEMATGPARLRADIAVAGYPFDGALGSASMAFGTLADLQGIQGEPMIQRLSVATAESEAGGPVFDATGAVLGMVLPGMAAGRMLPDGVSLALRADLWGDALAQAGIRPVLSSRTELLNRDRLARLGADMTVTVTCWN